MKIINSLLHFLRGKKGSIASIIGLVVAYLAVKDILGQPEVILIMGISTILFGTASYMTKQLVYKK